MNNEQIALRLMQELQDMSLPVAVCVLEGAMSHVRAIERARCVAIVEQYADPTFLSLVRMAASEMLGAIEKEE